jgi:protein TonB
MRRIEGRVTVEFVVGLDGKTGRIVVSEAQPDDTFVAATVRAIELWRFKPGIRDGRPVPVRVRQTIRFQLEE